MPNDDEERITNIQPDFLALSRSVNAELQAVKDRVRNVIGKAHWLTEGGHKEWVLRTILRGRLPGGLFVGGGFVVSPLLQRRVVDKNGHVEMLQSTTQLDVIVAHAAYPLVFQSGDVLFVYPEAASAVIEVKTSLKGESPRDILSKLADQVQAIRRARGTAVTPWAGLFVYEEPEDREDCEVALLEALQDAAKGELERVINCIAVGPSCFVRHWYAGDVVGSEIPGPVWHAYSLKDVAPAYFISNLAATFVPASEHLNAVLFPVPGGKELRRTRYIGLGHGRGRSEIGYFRTDSENVPGQ